MSRRKALTYFLMARWKAVPIAAFENSGPLRAAVLFPLFGAAVLLLLLLAFARVLAAATLFFAPALRLAVLVLRLWVLADFCSDFLPCFISDLSGYAKRC